MVALRVCVRPGTPRKRRCFDREKQSDFTLLTSLYAVQEAVSIESVFGSPLAVGGRRIRPSFGKEGRANLILVKV